MLKCVALVGATASGKSALALELAQQHSSCVIACDSMQVYQGLDIGTAKASAQEQSAVEHAVIDVVSLPTVFSAADWVQHTLHHIQCENEAGRVPLIVGGCGFYLRALLEGLSPIPDEKQSIRDALTTQWKLEGNAWLHRQVAMCDPEVAIRLHESDSQRLLRALSVYQSSGQTLSQWQKQAPTVVEIDCPIFVLDMPREKLYTRINQRFDQMMVAGWMKETQWLQQQHVNDMHPAMRAVGYRQLLDALNGLCCEQEAVMKGKTATRRYAKRQQTWFRHQLKTAILGSHDDLQLQLSNTLAKYYDELCG